MRLRTQVKNEKGFRIRNGRFSDDQMAELVDASNWFTGEMLSGYKSVGIIEGYPSQ